MVDNDESLLKINFTAGQANDADGGGRNGQSAYAVAKEGRPKQKVFNY